MHICALTICSGCIITLGLQSWIPSCPEMRYGRMQIILSENSPAVGINANAAAHSPYELHWGVFESMSWGNTLSPYWMARSMAGVSRTRLSYHIFIRHSSLSLGFSKFSVSHVLIYSFIALVGLPFKSGGFSKRSWLGYLPASAPAPPGWPRSYLFDEMCQRSEYV